MVAKFGEEFCGVFVVAPGNGFFRTEGSFGELRMKGCGGDAAEVDVDDAGAIGSAENGANIAKAADVVEKE